MNNFNQMEVANTMDELRQLAQEFGVKAKLWYYDRKPRSVETAPRPFLVSVNAQIAYGHMKKPINDRALFFKTCKTQDQMGKTIQEIQTPKIDQNSLSNPALLEFLAANPEALKELQKGVKALKKEAEVIAPEQSQVPAPEPNLIPSAKTELPTETE